MHTPLAAIPIIALFCVSLSAVADYKDDIGYTRLLQEQGTNTPKGTGVLVTQSEALTGAESAYMPDVDDAEFIGKAATIKNASNTNAAISAHATGVGRWFYGNNFSIAPAVSMVNVYDGGRWMQPDYLLFGYSGNPKPQVSADRVANHSWIAASSNLTYNSAILRRTDWVVETDEFIQCVGIKNNYSPNQSLLSGAYNVMAVGKSDGLNGYGTTQLDSDYVSGRVRPEMVAPVGSSSGATAMAAAATALLVELGNNNAGLSTDPVEISTTNRYGSTIYNAERSEVIKAVLMAGADRATHNSQTPPPGVLRDITDYRLAPANQSANGLDVRYGAGQINIYNSFNIVAAGEQNSDEDDGTGSGTVGLSGFDYDPFFGGSGGSNTTAAYFFSSGANAVVFSATLAWNMKITWGNSSSLSGSATLHNLDLALYDVTGGGQILLQSSASTIDNTETIWTTLDAGKDYMLQVSRQGLFSWDFALAWQSLLDSDSDGVPDSTDHFPNDPAETADTDDDGIGNNADPDDDNDGLPDVDEVTYGTGSLIADTDGDGFTDGMEVNYGSNPLLGTSTPADNVINNGDINNDTQVNVADVLLATRILQSELVPTTDQLVRMDMVPDGQATAGDLVRIQQLALGL